MQLDVQGRLEGLNGVFRRTVAVAGRVMRRRVRVLMLVRSAYRRMGENETALDQIAGDLASLLRLTRAWATRRYRGVPWKSVMYAVAAILYFVNPVDLIPDAIVGIGFLDDAAVIGAVVSAISRDLRSFEAWEREQAVEGAPRPSSAANGSATKRGRQKRR